MEVLIPRLSGFCPGVKTAENRIFRELAQKNNGSFSVLGMMINNRKYIEYLSSKNIKTVEQADAIPGDSTVFIRTHGIDRELQQTLEREHRIIDLTCRNVKRVQETILENSQKGALIIITGKKTHPEVTGLKSYGSDVIVIETEEDLESFLSRPEYRGEVFSPENYSGIFVTSQTTGSRKLFESAIRGIGEKWPEIGLSWFNSICPVTEKKEKEALELQKKADISIVIGDPLSSNANKLYKLLKEQKSPAYFIQDAAELKNMNIDFTGCNTAMVVSSASTPDFVEEEVTAFLRSI